MADFTLLERFTTHADEHGSGVALCDAEGSVTYAELHHRSNQLARLLRDQGVGPGTYVGLALRRSNALIMAILAVVKTGGAYVPLDPDYPDARLTRMLEQAQPRVILTEPVLVSRFTPHSPFTFALDGDFAAAESTDDLPVVAGPLDPLYVIFTSGSTGDPKGAIVHRRGFANLLEWFGREFAIGSRDRVLLLSSPSFDLTQKNFFAALQAGGTLVSFPSGPFDLTLLADLIEKHRVTMLNCTPSAFYPLVDQPSRISSLRLAVLGGEPISIPRVREWLETSPEPRAEIANTYGPTECTDICGFYRLNRANLDAFAFVPLGHTIPNVQLAVVDDSLKSVPIGEDGELLIGGTGVGLGYLADPGRTAASFVPNPLPEHLAGPLAYRTGDRVRLLAEGELEFLGRADHQVKLRGYRIELSEIEIALAAHPAVREAVVLLDKSQAEPVLTAFFTWREGSATPENLRAFLAGRLPEYMVPAKFEPLEAFPLTPNGKVDRLTLSQTSGGRPQAPTPLTGTPAEQTILSLWRTALGHDAIGLDDNFFDLGGNSIQLAMVHARVTRHFGKPIPITDLFAYPTVRTLAAHLAGDDAQSKSAGIRDRALRQRQALAARRATKV